MDLTSQIPSLPSTFHILKLSSGSFIDKGDACRNARILSKVTIKLTSFREKHTKYNVLFLGVNMTSETGGSLYTGCMDMYGPKGYGFSAVLVINRVSILVNLVSNRVGFFSLQL